MIRYLRHWLLGPDYTMEVYSVEGTLYLRPVVYCERNITEWYS